MGVAGGVHGVATEGEAPEQMRRHEADSQAHYSSRKRKSNLIHIYLSE